MRYGIVADIHANLAAFETVLADMGKVDVLWCLGDLVGYGPDPNECAELLRRHDHLCVVGNHDLAAIRRLDTRDFNPDAARAAEWTARQLSERSRLFLSALPERVVAEPFTLVHGSPRSPVWEYVTHEGRATPNFQHFQTRACLVGHTHVPALYVEESPDGPVTGRAPGTGDQVEVGPKRLIANPGGVGQPRDGDPRAAYALFDSDSGLLEWRRVDYPIHVTQQKMREFGLPSRLIERLDNGW
ncbi:MAG: metallophosphoesterase family protein [Chloroflexota bacterium]